ncbi:major histocompatibility complex class I-related gene protein-like [Salmo trutta]|uniref:Major histocompatibility complex class I-related gene protein-like n=1 Tax=Salmo trutta TaxID=8032 RepID=A0A674A1S9_SALTR|nr:major histocompatibility complex class I-related gene protein-like [Salmo trutta]XP_029623984.1 major histocompatibility complex class I-related gene protein-like [Salmo trutta]XP_029623985.1 major histocompatibility complex class I-related gene protein-like [Salmo trutta]
MTRGYTITIMGKLSVFLFVLSFYPIVNAGSGSHSLWALATYISGETPFPEFTVVLMLDDVQVTYYDSNDKQYVYRGQNIKEKTEDDEAKDEAHIYGDIYHSMKDRSFELKHHFNLTEGVQVQQRWTGCEMMDNGEPGLAMFKNIFNGISEDYAMYYNTTHVTYNAGKILLGWDWKMQAYNINKFENYYLPICIKHLKTLLKREKNIVMRKVPPRLRLIKKEVSGGFQVSCLAFGFYPRHINLTLLRDGQPVAEQELTGGEVLPSGDGTYQLRKSLEVSTEELKKRHNYTCTASHLSLDNKLDVSWESGAERVHLSTLSVLLMMLLILILLVIFICVKRRWSNTASQMKLANFDAKVSEEMNLSSDSET